VITDQTN